MRRRYTLLAVFALFGCGGGQTGGETGADELGEETADPCVETPTTLAIDEQSPLGFSAADVLAFSEGTHTALVKVQMDLEQIGFVIKVGAQGLMQGW